MSDRVLTWDTDAPLQALLDRDGCPPLLRRTLTGTLSWQMRNQTPIGRALASSRAAPQAVAALLALGATVTVGTEAGETEVPLADLLQGEVEGEPRQVHVPLPGEDECWGEARVARTPADDPIVAGVAWVRVDEAGAVRDARVALTGAWPGAARLVGEAAQLVGPTLTAPRIAALAADVEAAVAPAGDYLGSEEYRRAMAGVVTRRALEQCLAQGEGSDE
jgi:CO/xanthine dehydrogenase FAD-binding subunit